MDGTFSVTPPGFAQLHTFHGLRNGRNLVGIHALLVNKRIDAYVEPLTELGRLTNDVVPESFMVDFEQAMINALGQMYPGIPLKGLSFPLIAMHFQESSGIRAFAHVHCRYRLPYQYQDDSSYQFCTN